MAQELVVSEIQSLDNEYQWVLDHEVKRTLKDLQNILAECIVKFPVAITEEAEGTGGVRNNLKIPDMEKFVLTAPSTSPSDQVKVVVTLTGDKISHADINLKLPKGGKEFYQNTSIREDAPWGLQQVQDAANHLRLAVQELEGAVDAKSAVPSSVGDENEARMNTADEVGAFVSRFMASILRSRSALVNPKKRTLEDLRNSRHARGLVPAIPPELALSFYLQGFKLIFAVYHIVADPKTNVTKFNRYQAEAVVPWVNDVILYLTIALQTAQQLKDKISVFTQYQDFTPCKGNANRTN